MWKSICKNRNKKLDFLTARDYIFPENLKEADDGNRFFL